MASAPGYPAAMSTDPGVLTARHASLLLGPSGALGLDPAHVVEWFGAMQGQDLASVLWSVGVRTGVDRSAVSAALDAGHVLRTWPMRGTLHLVPARDARWMVRHLGARALARAARRREFLGLSEHDADRAADVLGQALVGGHQLSRSACVDLLVRSGIPAAGQRAYHLLWYASQRGVTCVGPNEGSEQTFVLLDEWAPDPVALDRAAALATIAGRFVRSHGPVTAHDLARWADLTLADARAGLRDADGVTAEQVAGAPMYVHRDCPAPAPSPADLPAHALPGFDELVLGYRDRSAQLDRDHEPLVVPGGNGVFSATLVVGGRVVGTWRRTLLAHRVRIEAAPFRPLGTQHRAALEQALGRYAEHVGRIPEVRWTAPG